ncbi:5'-nucleotidase [Cadophora sp. MPI-SDFR-AT-0126]|nr:5'-nucleotidase [Leotiomycetes sp. MPI-SDFR-AT-0126]
MGDIFVDPHRAAITRFIIVNTGGVRFDLVKGPFTIDDSIVVAPFPNVFKYLPSVPYVMAVTVLDSLNAQPGPAKRDSEGLTWGTMPQSRDSCQDPTLSLVSGMIGKRDSGIVLRQRAVTPGYTRIDDFATDGHDTPHSAIPNYPIPKYFQGIESFPSDGSTSAVVNVIFLDYFAAKVVGILRELGANYISMMSISTSTALLQFRGL